MGVRPVRWYSRQGVIITVLSVLAETMKLEIGRDGDARGVSLVDALYQASIGRVPKFDGFIVTSGAKEFAVGREREGKDVVGVALHQHHQKQCGSLLERR